ncbi:MAG: sulfite exporter TauE/SafE family protein [Acidobacteria bacterium]|nr:sulfite exporter TauE/SafE family protein [Acidobacteriota bacterium]
MKGLPRSIGPAEAGRHVLAAAIGVIALSAGAPAAHPSTTARGALSNVEGQSPAGDHVSHSAHAAVSEPSTLDFTVNVAVSDTAILPSSVFVPAGRPVQLVLRSRGSLEHHYRVVGLVPDAVSWMAILSEGAPAAVSTENHDHHGRTFVSWRGPSPAGIRPSGREVHAYVSGERRVDAVLFTATETGTYVVQCDLHPQQVAHLTVFDAGPAEAGHYVRGVRLQPDPVSRHALTAALTKDLGTVDYGGASGVRVEATYAPAEYVTQILGEATPGDLNADEYVAVLLSERLHTANLPDVAVPADLRVNGAPVPLIDRRTVADSPHHRATVYRFARDASFGTGHQMMTLHLASGQEATWHLPLVLPRTTGESATGGFADQWALVLALLGGMLAAMWPCLFQLTVYFIPALAGVAMQNGGPQGGSRRRQVLTAAFYFILGFTFIYTATGALIGYAAGRLGSTGEFEAWQRYIGVAAGLVVLGLALRVAAKVRAPLVCRMPVLSRMAHSGAPATRLEMMVAGLAFATGCMTCFGSALVVGMVVYVGLAQSAFYGAMVLFLFSLGMGIPLVIAAMAMARALPLLLKLERAVPWMGLASAALMAAFGLLLISGNYMAVSEWTYRLASLRP